MLEHIRGALIWIPAAGFILSGLAVAPLRFWFSLETGNDLRPWWVKEIALWRGDWPDLPAAVWSRRAMAGALGCWCTTAVVVIVFALLEELP